MQNVLLIVAVGIAAVFVTGYSLKKLGRPFKTLPLTLHKLLGVGVFIYLAVTVVRLARAGSLNGLGWGLCLSAGALFLAALASGGWLAAAKGEARFAWTMHRILPRLAVIATIAWFFLLIRR